MSEASMVKKISQELTPEQKVRRLISLVDRTKKHFIGPLFEGQLNLISASSTGPDDARCIFEFKNDEHWANFTGNCHGGVISTIFDICTSMVLPIIGRPGFWQWAGVSRTLNVTYLKPVPTGEVVLVDCELVSAGARMALLRGTIKRKSDGVVLCTCEHNKVNSDPPAQAKL